MAHFPIMSIEQANPGLWRARQYGEIDRQNREAMFAPFTLAQELKKMQQFNQYYPEEIQAQNRSKNAYADLIDEQSRMYAPNILSEISHRGMQSQHLGAQNALLGEQTAGLQYNNNLNNRWQALEDAKYDVNNMTPSTQGSNSNSMLSSWTDLAPDIYASAHEINEQQDHNSPNYVPNLPSPLEQRKQYEQRGSVNVAPTAYPTITDTYAQAQQNNAPMQSANPGSVSEYMKNLGLTGQQGDMSMAPQQDQPFVPSPQNLNSLRQGAQSAAQMPAQMPAQFDPNARLNQINQQQAAIAARLGKGRVGAESPQEKMDRTLDLEKNKQDIKAYEKINEGAASRAASASDAITQLDILKEASSKLNPIERGPYKGKLPAFSEAAQVYDKTSAALQKAVMDGMKGQGQMSKAKMEFIEKIKPNRNMDKAASERIGDTLKAMAERSLEEQPFFTLAQKSGLNHKEAQSLWTLYNKERPEYDAKRQAPIDGNLNKYNEYLNQNALEAALRGKPYDPRGTQNKNIALKEVKGASSNAKNDDMVTVMASNGQRGSIPRSKLDEALKRGAREI